MAKLFFTIVSCSLSMLAFAQSKYTLENIWSRALQQYPSLTANKEFIEQQKLNKALVRQQFLPEVNVQAQQSYGSFQNVPGSFFSLPGMYTVNGSKTGAAAAGGSSVYSSAVLQWNVVQFGRLGKKLAMADAAINIEKASLKQEEWRLLSNATRSYFTVLNHVAVLDIARAHARRLSDLFDLLKSQSNAGLRPGADTLLIKSALSQAKSKIHEQQSALQSSLAQLSALTGENISLENLDTAVYHNISPNSIGAADEIRNHPYIALMNERIHYGEAGQQVIRKEVLPSIGLLAGAGVKGSGLNANGSISKGLDAPWTNAAGSYLAGIGITWNFSSLYQNKTKRAMAEHEVAALKAERQAVKIQLEADYAAAMAAWREQREKLVEAETSLSASQKAYELYEVRYHSGLISLIELLQLQKSLQDAESFYTASLFSYWNELIHQAESLGNPSLLLTAIKP